MNKTWLLVIVLAIATVVVLSFTWQNIPYVNTAITDLELDVKIQQLRDTISGTISDNPWSVVGAGTGGIGTVLMYLKNTRSRLQTTQINLQETLVTAQKEKGTLMAGFSDVKDTLLGAKDKLQSEFDTLKVQSETEITDLKELVDVKDNKIIDVQDELTKVQQQLIAQSQELKEAVTQRDEYRIALKIKEVPTLH